MYYYEQKSLHGGWTPALSAEKPDVKTRKGQPPRLNKTSGMGSQVRAITKVPTDMLGLTLSQISQRLGHETKQT